MKGARGEITVFLSLILFAFLAFFAALLEGIRVRNAKLSGERTVNLGMSSAFAEYYQPLWEEYHLFGLAREGLEDQVKGYMTFDYGLLLEDLQIEEVVWGTDYEGGIFLHQIEAYEKYRIVPKLLGEGFAERFGREAEAASGEAWEKTAELPDGLEDEKEGRPERKKMADLRALWGKGIMELVLDNPAGISQKRLEKVVGDGERTPSISSTSPQRNLKQVKNFLQEKPVRQGELFYYQEHFKSFCKKEIKFQKKESRLDYELEYLLEEKGSDRENMESWLARLVLTRTALNYLVISQDGAKNQAAYGMAFSALGFTGIEALVRLGQQFILLSWSYEEALVDARVLLEGGKVPLWKDKNEFSISFGELFIFSRELLKERANQRLVEKRAYFMDYEEYLSLCLGFKKEERRRQAAWRLIDENMRLRYEETFSLEDTVFGIHMKARWLLPGRLGKDWRLESERHYSY